MYGWLYIFKTMDVKEKQKFELAFNYIGNAMTKAFESAEPQRKKEIGNFIKCLNVMYMYTNKLESNIIIKKQENDTTFRRKRIQQERFVRKNGG